MREVFIVGAARTPIGSYGGSLSGLKAPQLGAAAIRASIERSRVEPAAVEEMIFGNVLSAGVGQAPARQAALAAGLPESVPSTTVNKVCSSGMKALIFGAQSILLGDRDLVLTGGMESMSSVPYYSPSTRFGAKAGHQTLIDGVIADGLWDVYNDFHMGNAAELCAREYGITRREQDEYAIESYSRALRTEQAGGFGEEIAPVSVPLPKGGSTIVSSDEEPGRAIFEKIPKLKPVFEENGTITAANASTLNDGASAILLASAEAVRKHALVPLARIASYADAEQAPAWFTTTPSIAIPMALERAGLSREQIDAFEINEAYAAVALANIRLLGLSPENVNVFGGAVALGHPLGSSGSRIIVTLLSVLRSRGGRYGVAGICNGGGGASAVIIEQL
jgi:acetyl-CoA C-acetyltransferase